MKPRQLNEDPFDTCRNTIQISYCETLFENSPFLTSSIEAKKHQIHPHIASGKHSDCQQQNKDNNEVRVLETWTSFSLCLSCALPRAKTNQMCKIYQQLRNRPRLARDKQQINQANSISCVGDSRREEELKLAQDGARV